MKEYFTNTKSKTVEITTLEPISETDILDSSVLSLAAKAEARPGYVKDERLTPHLAKVASLGYEYGMGLDVSTRFSEYDSVIRDKLYNELAIEGEALHSTPHFVTVYDIYANAAFKALQQNRVAAAATSQAYELPVAS